MPLANTAMGYHLGSSSKQIWASEMVKYDLLGGGDPNMFRCLVCGQSQSNEEYVSEVFMVDGKHILVENIPAQVCNHCGEPTFSRETTEKVRLMVHGEAEPVGTLEMEVFTYQP
jgi:HTH-type transcriptional regulator/antitoxin MqsA